MINVSELLWLHNMGVPDGQIQALYNKEETSATPAEPAAPAAAAEPAKQEPAAAAPAAAKQEPAAQAAQAAEVKQEPAAVKQDPTSAALLEVIKSLQAQNAQLAAGKQPEGTQSVEDMLLSLI